VSAANQMSVSTYTSVNPFRKPARPWVIRGPKNKTHRSGKAGPMRMGKSVCCSTAAGLDAGLADEKSQSR
jgi:hypothetical protein